jgi:hypothetical protein
VRLSAQIRYDADPAQVFSMLVDPDFQEAKCQASGSVEHEVEVSVGPDGDAKVISRRTMPTERVPDYIKSLLGGSLRLLETQQWQPAAQDGSRTGSVIVQIEGAPVRFTGSMALAATDGGTLEPIEGELKASVPLFGARIEQAVQPAVMAAIRVEQRTGTAWLARR